MYKIFSKKVAEELIRKGHTLVALEPNRDNSKFQVFIFRDTEQLHIDLTVITALK
ncbi:hypothetical protein [Clostridium novyi]|uniref:hypothetical protein n=1 Tax=Clostridium novyi TaxID=1542 RepID=UPI000B2ED4BB|nr:hypothetical protein [Clostridium novyi]